MSYHRNRCSGRTRAPVSKGAVVRHPSRVPGAGIGPGRHAFAVGAGPESHVGRPNDSLPAPVVPIELANAARVRRRDPRRRVARGANEWHGGDVVRRRGELSRTRSTRYGRIDIHHTRRCGASNDIWPLHREEAGHDRRPVNSRATSRDEIRFASATMFAKHSGVSIQHEVPARDFRSSRRMFA